MLDMLLLVAVLQAPPSAFPGHTFFGWDCPAAYLSRESIVRFEVQWDSQEPVAVGMPKDAEIADTCSVAVPALTPGPHTVRVRGCSASVCGPEWTPAVAFSLVVAVNPPPNPRLFQRKDADGTAKLSPVTNGGGTP